MQQLCLSMCTHNTPRNPPPPPRLVSPTLSSTITSGSPKASKCACGTCIVHNTSATGEARPVLAGKKMACYGHRICAVDMRSGAGRTNACHQPARGHALSIASHLRGVAERVPHEVNDGFVDAAAAGPARSKHRGVTSAHAHTRAHTRARTHTH